MFMRDIIALWEEILSMTESGLTQEISMVYERGASFTLGGIWETASTQSDEK